jgi:myo-inositol 2-dehydrogenase/D-chiro-inositol 1-dehydrogenase
MINVGLLGAGRIAGVHASAISSHPSSSLVAVSDINHKAAQSLASSYGCEVRDSEQIIADQSIHAVLIATSTNTHSELMEQATAAGKAVLCEKPVDLDLQRARECQSRIQKTGQPVMIGFNRRFDPNFAALQNALSKGEIGEAELLSITSFDPAPPPTEYIKVSGGLFKDMMIHDFDMANFIMGEVPITLIAVASSMVNPEIEKVGDVDTAVVTMQYLNGSMAVIKNSRRAAYGYDQRLEILGSDGLLQAQNVLENTIVKSTQNGVLSAKPPYFFLERYMLAYRAEWATFMDAIIQKKDIPVGMDDGVTALAMAEAAKLSFALGEPVELSKI